MKNNIIIFYVLLLCACANRVTPTGGPKDVAAPELLNATPSNAGTGFSSSEIRLVFNENIQLLNPSAELLVSPLMTKMPVLKVSRNELLIELPDSLLPNTTYTIDFGKSIADVNEGNILNGFRYVFSTGNVLDTLFAEGMVLDSYTMTPVKGALVMLYKITSVLQTDDSLPCLKVPDYFARCNDSGSFIVRNIPAGNYKIFALSDKNGNYLFDDPEAELFAFRDSDLAVPAVESMVLRIGLQEPARIKVNRIIRADRHTAVIAFNKQGASVGFKFFADDSTSLAASWYSDYKDTLYLYCGPSTDSLKLMLTENGIPFDTVLQRMIPAPGSKEQALKLKIRQMSSPSESGPSTNLILSTGHPMESTPGTVYLKEDTLSPIAMKPVMEDATRGLLSVRYPWKKGVVYSIEMLPGTVRDIFQNTIDTTRFILNIPTPENTATLSVKFKGKSGSPAFLQVLNDKYELLRSVPVDFKSSVTTLQYLKPGNVRLRIVVDQNKDGRWTPAQFSSRRQAEPVYIHPDPLTLRSNWETELLFDLSDR